MEGNCQAVVAMDRVAGLDGEGARISGSGAVQV